MTYKVSYYGNIYRLEGCIKTNSRSTWYKFLLNYEIFKIKFKANDKDLNGIAVAPRIYNSSRLGGESHITSVNNRSNIF